MTNIRIIVLASACVLAVAPLSWGQTPSEKLAARKQVLLDPSSRVDARGFAAKPVARPTPAKIERPEPAPTKIDAVPPLSLRPESKPLRPRSAPEPSALMAILGSPAVPQRVTFTEGVLAKQHGSDVQKPLPLPILGAYVKDRVSLADPSGEVSAVLILSPQKPKRLEPVPFSPWNLPDPFENQWIRLPQAWPEDREPPLFVPPPTRR